MTPPSGLTGTEGGALCVAVAPAARLMAVRRCWGTPGFLAGVLLQLGARQGVGCVRVPAQEQRLPAQGADVARVGVVSACHPR